MSQKLSHKAETSTKEETDPKIVSKGALEHPHLFRVLRASLWKMERRNASPILICLMSFLMNFVNASPANADPKDNTLLAKRRNSSRLSLRRLLESSDDDLESYNEEENDERYNTPSDLPPPPLPFEVRSWEHEPSKRASEETKDLMLDHLDLSVLYHQYTRRPQVSSSLSEFTIDLQQRLPLEIAWEKMGNLVENTIDRADREWKLRYSEDYQREYHQPEVKEINLWKSFSKECEKFLTPRLRLSSKGVTLINNWEWGDHFEVSIKSRFVIDENILDSIKAKAELREEILDGLLRIIARYRFRPGKAHDVSLEARFDYQFAEECNGFISATTHINGESVLQVGFSLQFGGSKKGESSQRYRESQRYKRSAGQRARIKLDPERGLTKLAIKAQRRADDNQ